MFSFKTVHALYLTMVADQLKNRGRYNHYAPESLPNSSKKARKAAVTRVLWESLEEQGLVKIEWEPDNYTDYNDLAGDTYDVELNKDSVPGGERTIKAQEEKFKIQIADAGVWMAHTFLRTTKESPWQEVSCLGGLIGFGWASLNDSGQAVEIMEETIHELCKTLKGRCPCCRQQVVK